MYQFEFDPVELLRSLCDTRFVTKRPRDPVQLAKQVFEAGLSDHVWSLEEIVIMADRYAPIAKPRGPYQKKLAA